MSVVQGPGDYRETSGPKPEPRSVWLITDGAPGEDLQALHDRLMKAVEGLKAEHHEPLSGVALKRELEQCISRMELRRLNRSR